MDSNYSFSEAFELDDWDEWLLTTYMPHPFQSTSFGDYCTFIGFSVRYLNISHNGEIMGKCLIYCKDRVASWLYGPVISDKYLSKYEIIIDFLIIYLREGGIIHIERYITQNFYDKIFLEKFIHVYEMPYLDLRSEIYNIEVAYSRSLLKGVNKCKKLNVKVKLGDSISLLNEYHALLRLHRNSSGLGMPFLYPNEESIKFFNKSNIKMEVAIAYIGAEALAALGFITFGGVVIEVGSAQAYGYKERKIPAYEFIKTEVTKVYKQRGINFYDLMGVKKNPETTKEKNIRKFKLKFTKLTGQCGYVEGISLRRVDYLLFRVKNKAKRLLVDFKKGFM